MPTALPVSAYVVLGLLGRHDGATPYQLDQRIRQSIGHFWVFPRSQLYAEAGRLVRRGLVVERQEEGAAIGAPCRSPRRGDMNCADGSPHRRGPSPRSTTRGC